jgi:hypothetical protein
VVRVTPCCRFVAIDLGVAEGLEAVVGCAFDQRAGEATGIDLGGVVAEERAGARDVEVAVEVGRVR